MNSSKSAINKINLWSRKKLLLKKQEIKITKINIHPKQQYKCDKYDKTYFKKGSLKTHIKIAHNISNNITKKEFMAISTNNESDNNYKNIEVGKVEVAQAKEQEEV